MTRKKPATPDPKPTTVAELLLALASFPQDAHVVTSENGSGGGALAVMIDDDWIDLWEGHDYECPKHYERPDVILEAVERSHPGEEYAIAVELLEWLGRHDVVLYTPGHGHNETASPLHRKPRELAEEFADREVER